MQRIVLNALLAFAMLVDGFFALVNFYPVAPTRSRGQTMYVYADLTPAQARWFEETLLHEFNEDRNRDVRLRAVPEEEITEAIGQATAHGDAVLLATLPAELAVRAAQGHHVQPFDNAMLRARIQSDFSGFSHELMSDASFEGRQYFLPRIAALDVAAYRVSRVRDAEEHWQVLRAEIEIALRKVNGRGLPDGYVLERSPALWDSFDLFVLAYYWAHRKYPAEPTRPRVAHRTGRSLEAQIETVQSLFRYGARTGTITQYAAPASQDYYSWETLFARHGLYVPEMSSDDGFDDDDVLKSLHQGTVFFATLNQMDAFELHGGSHRGMPSQVDDPEDLAFVGLPVGVSVQVDAGGHPARHSPPFAFRNVTVWTLPTQSPDVNLAYDLVAFVMNHDNHARECAALGTLPIRDDVIRSRASLFRVTWMSDVFAAGLAEWPASSRVSPGLVGGGPASVYTTLWHDLVARPPRQILPPPAVLAALNTPPAESPMPPPPLRRSFDGRPPGGDDEPARINPESWRLQLIIVPDVWLGPEPDASDDDADKTTNVDDPDAGTP